MRAPAAQGRAGSTQTMIRLSVIAAPEGGWYVNFRTGKTNEFQLRDGDLSW